MIDLVANWPKTNIVDGKIALRAWYETKFGLYDHSTKGAYNPLSSVALHDTEENGQTSGLYELIANYAAKNIGTTFHISLPEFLALPKEYVTYILEIADKHKQTDLQGLQSTKAALDGQINAMKQAGKKPRK